MILNIHQITITQFPNIQPYQSYQNLYCVLQIGNQNKHTDILKHPKFYGPTWNTKFTFTNYAPFIQIYVWNKTQNYDNFVGQGKLDIKNLNSNTNKYESVQIVSQQGYQIMKLKIKLEVNNFNLYGKAIPFIQKNNIKQMIKAVPFKNQNIQNEQNMRQNNKGQNAKIFKTQNQNNTVNKLENQKNYKIFNNSFSYPKGQQCPSKQTFVSNPQFNLNNNSNTWNQYNNSSKQGNCWDNQVTYSTGNNCQYNNGNCIININNNGYGSTEINYNGNQYSNGYKDYQVNPINPNFLINQVLQQPGVKNSLDLANKFSGTNSSQNNNSWGYNQNPYSGFW